MLDLTPLHRSAGSLFEAPLFDVSRGLIFSDARLGGVFSLSSTLELQTVVEHRRGIGGLAPHESGGLIVTGRNVAHKELGSEASLSATSVLLDASTLGGVGGFNDLTVDTLGRVYVGALAAGSIESQMRNAPVPMGAVFVIDLDGSSRIVDGDVRLANGMGFSPDGRILYLCDSGRRVVFSFDVDLEGGHLGTRRVVIDVQDGVPDGIAVAVDGSIWVAHAQASFIRRYTTEGKTIETVPVPSGLVTSLCFGGDEGRQVFITTGANDPAQAAVIYTFEADIAGVEVPPARVGTEPALPAAD